MPVAFPALSSHETRKPSLRNSLITVAFDARPLQPRTRHWGVGVVLDSLVPRLTGKFNFAGISRKFPGSEAQGLKTWPKVPRANLLFFELSALLADRKCDIYWGTNHFVPACCRKPSVVTVHDLLLLKYPDEQPS